MPSAAAARPCARSPSITPKRRRHRRQEGRCGSDVQPEEAHLYPPHTAFPAAGFHLADLGVMVGHEQVVALGFSLEGIRHAEWRCGVDHAVQAAPDAVGVGVVQLDVAPADQRTVLWMAEAAREDPDFRGAEGLEDRLQQDGTAERIGVADPLGEDVRTATADARCGAFERSEGGGHPAQDTEIVEYEALAKQTHEPGLDRRLTRRARCADDGLPTRSFLDPHRDSRVTGLAESLRRSRNATIASRDPNTGLILTDS